MKHLAIMLVLLGACTADVPAVEDQPAAGSESVDVGVLSQDLDVGSIACELQSSHVNLEGWSVPAKLPSNTPGVARPPDQKLLSTSCPTCPLLWVYPVGSLYYLSEIQAAAKLWNDALGWKVVGVYPSPPSTPAQVPTYGTVISMNDTYTPPGYGENGYYVAGINTWNWYRQNRDAIWINLDLPPISSTTRSRIIAHEIGHSLIRAANWHDISVNSIMYSTQTPSSYVVHNSLRTYLNNIRREILEWGESYPCAFRRICP